MVQVCQSVPLLVCQAVPLQSKRRRHALVLMSQTGGFQKYLGYMKQGLYPYLDRSIYGFFLSVLRFR